MQRVQGGLNWKVLVFWTALCGCILIGSPAFLLLAPRTAVDSIPAFLCGFVVAGPSFIFVVVFEIGLGCWHSGTAEAMGLMLFVVEWLAIWTIGFVSLLRTGRIPWLRIGGVVGACAVIAGLVFWGLAL